MAKALNVNPNRMELSRLKRQLVVAKRGHKLLKDKQDALVKEFLVRARSTYELRLSVEKELGECYGGFLLARAQTLPQVLEQTLMAASGDLRVNVEYRNVMSVRVPEYELPEQHSELNYGLAASPGSLDVALEKFLAVMPKLVHLAAEEKAVRAMALEIERTRRRLPQSRAHHRGDGGVLTPHARIYRDTAQIKPANLSAAALTSFALTCTLFASCPYLAQRSAV